MKISAIIAALLLATTVSLSQTFQKGDFSANVNTEGWSLNAGSGTRTHMIVVKFVKPFTKVPTVVLSVTTYDCGAGQDGNVRVSAKAEQVGRESFTLKISTWGDSRVAGIEGNWFAYTPK